MQKLLRNRSFVTPSLYVTAGRAIMMTEVIEMRASELKELRQNGIALSGKRATLSELESLAERVTQTLQETPRSPSPTNTMLEEIVLKIIEMKEFISEEAYRLQTRQLEAEYEIETRIQHCATRQILKLRYLKGESWAAIATSQKSSRSRVMRLHREGLKLFDT